MKYQKEILQFIGNSVKYEDDGGYIWGENCNELIAQTINPDEYEGTPLISVRGWGAIQHLFKTAQEQDDFQNELGLFIQDAINEKLSRCKNSN